ncbi:neuroglian-like [Photinus pyralis]|uniref:neuroglian-like n=1 Tax=Photinus pyralis TaxID=7054 RepID=UPI0012677356|nr:neuroglian-like [Photinus pyralis]
MERFKRQKTPIGPVDTDGNLWFSSITKLDETNEFLYVCYAYLEFGSSYKLGERISLKVVKNNAAPSEPVLQYVSPKNIPALAGKSIVIYCVYSGTPNPQTAWYKDGLILQPTSKSLSIQNVSLSDKGNYTCEVSNGVGALKVHSTHLAVFAEPKLIDEPEFLTVAKGESAEFRCTASGVPEPKINWSRNGKEIRNTSVLLTSRGIFIESVSKWDIGNFGCNASNIFGYAYKDVYLNVLAILRRGAKGRDDSQWTKCVFGM